MPYKNKKQQKEAQNQHYIKNKEAYYARTVAKRKLRQEWFKLFMSTKKCLICGESCSAVLDLHHINPEEKEELVSRLLGELRAFDRVVAEIEKCVVLCSNCHRKLHAGVITREFTPAEKLVVDCGTPEEPKFQSTTKMSVQLDSN